MSTTNGFLRELLSDIEEAHGIEILFASVAGSRATGLARENSDWDIRFVYRRPPEQYMSLKPPEDHLIIPEKNYRFITSGVEREIEVGLYGVDLFGFCKLGMKRNGLMYQDLCRANCLLGQDTDFWRDSTKLLLSTFNPSAGFYHWLGVCVSKKTRGPNTQITTLKSLGYILEGLCNALYILARNKPSTLDSLPELSGNLIERRFPDAVSLAFTRRNLDALDYLVSMVTIACRETTSKDVSLERFPRIAENVSFVEGCISFLTALDTKNSLPIGVMSTEELFENFENFLKSYQLGVW